MNRTPLTSANKLITDSAATDACLNAGSYPLPGAQPVAGEGRENFPENVADHAQALCHIQDLRSPGQGQALYSSPRTGDQKVAPHLGGHGHCCLRVPVICDTQYIFEYRAEPERLGEQL